MTHKSISRVLCWGAVVSLALPAAALAQPVDTIDKPIAAPSAGPSAANALATVFRVVDQKRGVSSTAFLYKNGWLITTYSAVANTEPSQIIVFHSNGTMVETNWVVRDIALGLAAIQLKNKISDGPALDVKQVPAGTPSSAILNWLPVGTPVAVWGRPTQYRSNWPLLYASHVAGAETVYTDLSFANQLLLFGAFDAGMDGSPVVDSGSGEIVGVLTTMPGGIEAANAAWFKRLEAYFSTKPITEPAPDGGAPVNNDLAIARSMLELAARSRPIMARAIPATDLEVFLRRLPPNP